MPEIYIIHYMSFMKSKEEMVNYFTGEVDNCGASCIYHSLIATPFQPTISEAYNIVKEDAGESESICLEVGENAFETCIEGISDCPETDDEGSWWRGEMETMSKIIGLEVFPIEVPENIYNTFIRTYDKEVELDSLIYITKSYCSSIGDRLNIEKYKKEGITYEHLVPASFDAHKYLGPIIDEHKLSCLKLDIDLYKIDNLKLLYKRMLELTERFNTRDIKVFKTAEGYHVRVKLPKPLDFTRLIELREHYLDDPQRIQYDLFIKSLPNIPSIRFTNVLFNAKYVDDKKIHREKPISWEDFLEELRNKI